MSIFRPDPVKKIINEINKASANSLKFKKLAGELARCEDFFISTIHSKVLLSHKRRQHHMSDAQERRDIREAVIYLLAAEELAFDLDALEKAQKFDQAVNRLTMLLIRMNLMSPGSNSVGLGDIYDEVSKDGNVTVPTILSERAALVGKGFVDKMITGVLNGRSIKPLIHSLLEANQVPVVENDEPLDVDFTQYSDTTELDDDIMDEFENMR